MKIFSLLICLFVIVTISCKKITRPKNYCYCKINGQQFKNSGKALMFGSGSLTARVKDNTLLIECSNKERQNITIWLVDSTTTNNRSGVHLLSGIPVSSTSRYGNQASFLDYNKSYKYEYSTDLQHLGVLKVKITEGRVTGMFAFKGKYEGGTDEEAEITEGEFSISLD